MTFASECGIIYTMTRTKRAKILRDNDSIHCCMCQAFKSGKEFSSNQLKKSKYKAVDVRHCKECNHGLAYGHQMFNSIVMWL